MGQLGLVISRVKFSSIQIYILVYLRPTDVLPQGSSSEEDYPEMTQTEGEGVDQHPYEGHEVDRQGCLSERHNQLIKSVMVWETQSHYTQFTEYTDILETNQIHADFFYFTFI